MDRREFPIRPGYASIMPPGVTSETEFPHLSRHLYAHFTLPKSEGDTTPIRAMQDLGEDFAPLMQSLEEALSYSYTHTLRAEIRLWDILWELAERSVAHEPRSRTHPAVLRALQIIEEHLTDPLRVQDIAMAAELSHNHLIRLFREATGQTVAGYIQHRRVVRARHLLRHSTMPIKAVATEVGVPDLHQFNKLIRRYLGESPRQVRAGQIAR
jgi:AraC-like DNA-binding protein